MQETTLVVELNRFEHQKLKAMADVTFCTDLGDLTVKGFKVIQRPGEEPWVGFPSTSYEKDGKPIHKPTIETSRLLKKRISEAVLAEFNKGQS